MGVFCGGGILKPLDKRLKYRYIYITIIKKSGNNMNTEKYFKGIGKLVVTGKSEIVQNPYSGQSVELESDAVAMYDYIKGCEMTGKYDLMQTALSYFMRRWPKEYMILLD